MSQHEKLIIDIGVKVHLAHPGSPWGRGINENTNGLIRQCFSKGTDFKQISENEIHEVRRKFNDQPCKVLNFYNSTEVFNNDVVLKFETTINRFT